MTKSADSAILLANLNALVLDYVGRQKFGGIALKFYTMKQLPVIPRTSYSDTDRQFILPRVLELVYTSVDMKPFAVDLGYENEPFIWNDDRRATLRAELDAYYARLYGLTRKQFRYILDPGGLSDAELADIIDPWEDPTCFGPHLLPAEPTTTFPGETFRVLKNREVADYGEYRTARLTLQAWAELEAEHGPALPKNYHDALKSAEQGESSLKYRTKRKRTIALAAESRAEYKASSEQSELVLVSPDEPPLIS